MSDIFRGESFELTFASENSEDKASNYGLSTSPANASVNQVPGIVEAATMPDPSYEWMPFYGYGDASVRNFYRMYKGKVSLVGSIGDMTLLSGIPLRFPIGKATSVGTDKVDADTTVAVANVEAGGLTVECAAIGSIINTDYIQIGDNAAENAECRRVTGAPAANVITLDYPLSYDHEIGDVLKEIQAPSATYPVTHTISEAIEIPSMTWLATYVGTDYSAADKATFLVRRFLGGKVNRATYFGSEGEPLKMSWDDVIFRDWRHNQETYDQSPAAGQTTATNKYDALVARVTPDYPTTEPYFFSYGVMTYFGYVFARVKSFRIEVVNNLEPKYYIASSSSAGQILYELREGRREYRISTTCDLGDEAVATKTDIIKELDIQGTYTETAVNYFRGFNMSLVFTRGSNDTITFTLPPSTAATGGDNQGCFIRSAPHNIVTDAQIPVDLDIIARSMQITVVDAEHYYP